MHYSCFKMEINNTDLRLTILGCFRYSIGRMTYMPSHTFMVIKNCKEIFRKSDWELFIREIDEYLFRRGISKNYNGRSCDDIKWQELKTFAEGMVNY